MDAVKAVRGGKRIYLKRIGNMKRLLNLWYLNLKSRVLEGEQLPTYFLSAPGAEMSNGLKDEKYSHLRNGNIESAMIH